MADASVVEVAATIWSRASRDPPGPRSRLILSIDGEGTETEWTERFARKAIARRIADSDARVWAMAGTTRLEVMWTRYEFLLVVAADVDADVGYLARIERDDSGVLCTGTRGEWTQARPAPFEGDILVRWLIPVRTAMLTTLRLGLHDAAKRRRSRARRRR